MKHAPMSCIKGKVGWQEVEEVFKLGLYATLLALSILMHWDDFRFEKNLPFPYVPLPSVLLWHVTSPLKMLSAFLSNNKRSL